MTILQHRYAQELPQCCVPWQPARWPDARELWFNEALAHELGLPGVFTQPEHRARYLSGQESVEGAQPVAQAYAGHQFGGFSPQLGDGRAILLGEMALADGRLRDLALKGSGRTPFSRGGDGKAAVGPMLREAIMGEAMHALGVPTTRALAVVATGEPVLRDRVLPGAVLARVAASHIRVGTFEYFAARQDQDNLRRLTDHAIARHDPELAHRPDRCLAFLRAVTLRQAHLLAQWMNLGFIHGVMNTDNMTISGETIDYGPCAFMEAFDPAAVFSSIDRNGRYAWNNQPPIAQWNLARLAEALLPLIDDDEDRALESATAVLGHFATRFSQVLLEGQRRKLGLTLAEEASKPTQRPVQSHEPASDRATDDPFEELDRNLVSDWLALLHRCSADYTRSWRALASALEGHETALRAEVADGEALSQWLTRWRARLVQASHDGGRRPAVQEVVASMRRTNPVVIPRNHQVEQALAAASDEQDLEPARALLGALARPYDQTLWDSPYAQAAPPEVAARHRTFCGT